MRKILKIPMQFFAEGAELGTEADPPERESSAEQNPSEPQPKTYTEAEYNAIQEELQKLRAEHLSQEEQTRLELTQRETEIANREAALRDRENRLHAVQSLESAGLCGGGITTADLMPFVMDSTSAGIDSKVKALSALLEKRAKAETERIYQGAGRQPHQVHNEDSGGGNPASLFGKERAAEQARAKAIREKYTGGVK